jgi:hypothetical protein
MANAQYPYTVDSAVLPPAGNINNYNALPTTKYRQFVDAIEALIKRVNALAISDDERLEELEDSLLDLQIEWCKPIEDEDDDITWSDDDDIG